MILMADNVDEYIERFSGEKKEKLIELRGLIQSKFPDLKEKISYAMPTYWLNGNVVHFACHQLHFGLYPGPDAIVAYQEELKGYKTSKGAIQFPYGEPLPLELITKIIQFSVDANLKKKSKNVIPFPRGE